MSSLESYIFQLSSGLISETSIPTEYLQIPEIKVLLVKYNWALRASNMPGWTNLIRQINYSS